MALEAGYIRKPEGLRLNWELTDEGLTKLVALKLGEAHEEED